MPSPKCSRREALSLIMTLAAGSGPLASTLQAAAPLEKKRTPMPISRPPVKTGLDPFTRSLYSQLARQAGNVTVSSTSIEAAVLLALAGARGETATEIAAALELTQADRADLARALARYRTSSGKANSAAVLTIANSAWVQKDFPIVDAYRKLVESSGGASFQTVDFAGDVEAARVAINRWVDEATRHKITELLSSGVLDDSARLVLANAIYFKGRWQEPFYEKGTSDQPFHRPGQPDVKVPLMHRDLSTRYLETETYQAIELAYEGTPHAMVVWLPKKLDGLAALERQLADGSLALDGLTRASVDVFLPKFKARSNVPLKEVLEALGMRRAFTDSAELQGISPEPLKIATVVHQALVEVDEKGTEAAAATAVVVAPTAAPFEPEPAKVFRADHPFLFAIRNTTTGEILFIGRYTDPAA